MYYYYSRSPLSEPEFYGFCLCFCFLKCRGDSQGSQVLNTLVLPPMNRKTLICVFCRFEHFWHLHEMGPQVMMSIIIGVGWPPILYIYSLGHFLTTKGALIDGDGYPPKNDQNWPLKSLKNHQFSLKFDVKKVSKLVILNGKIEFFTKIDTKWLKSDQKVTKIDVKIEC